MSTFDDIRDRVAAAADAEAAVSALLEALAARVKATSNDQNVQRLARDLRAASPALVQAIAAKPALAAAN